MSHQVVLLREAVEEFSEGAVWYEQRLAGLGLEFTAEIGHLIARIAETPLEFPQWVADDPVRRALSRRFPYAVFFDIEPERIVVVAIAHTSRRPGYWLRRGA